MCEYCEKEKELPIKIKDIVNVKEDLVLMLTIEKKEILILANLGFTNKKEKPQWISTSSRIKINYCPMCRKKIKRR